MKITKKQWIIGGAIALVLAGTSAGIVVNNQAQAEAKKIAQEAKITHDNLIKSAKKATEKAETFKAEADVKSAQDAIKKLDENDKLALSARVEIVRQNWELVNKADKAVANAEKLQNDANVKTAQTALDKIKNDMAKSKKFALQKRLEKVKTTVKNNKERAKAKAAEEAKSKAQADQAKQAAAKATPTKEAGTPEVSTPQVEEPIQTPETQNAAAPSNDTYTPYNPTPPVASGGGSTTPTPGNGGGSNPTPPGPGEGGAGDNGGGSTTPPDPVETFTGWVRNKAGDIVWSQGGFNTRTEAYQAAVDWLNSNATGGGWSAGAY